MSAFAAAAAASEAWGPNCNERNSRKIVLDANLQPLPQTRLGGAGQPGRSWGGSAIPDGFAKSGKHDLQPLVDAGESGRSHTSYLDYVIWAWTHHRPIVLSPDLIWFEALAKVAVSFTSMYTVKHYQTKWKIPEDAKLEFQTAVCGQLDLESMVSAIEASGLFPFPPTETFLPTFSTSTERSRMAAMSCFCDVASTLIAMCGGCGLPWVRLDGSAADWAQLASRVAALGDPFDKSACYLAGVAELAGHISAMLAEDREDDLVAFFRDFIKTERVRECPSGHGPVRVRGWITQLYGVQPFIPGKEQEGVDLRTFPQLASKVIWTDVRAPGKQFIAFTGVFGSIDKDGLPVPDFGHVTFEGPAFPDGTSVAKRARFKAKFDRDGKSGKVVAEALGRTQAQHGSFGVAPADAGGGGEAATAVE